MDLGEVEIENGCFVEEDGSTYCFCDFNRCNAAGILDLRNLIDDKNETFKPFKLLSKNTRHNNQFQSTILKPKDIQQQKSASYQKISASGNQNFSSKLTSYFTLPAIYSTLSMSRLDNTTRKIDTNNPNDRLDRILVNLFGTSKSVNSDLIKERIRNSSNPEKLIKKFEKYTMALLQNQNQKNHNRHNYAVKDQTKTNFINTSTPPIYTTTPSIQALSKINTTLSVVSFTQYQNEYEKINATFYKFTLPTTTTVASNYVNNMPSLYKLNINDSFSKNLIENKEFRSRFGLKPKERLNLLLLKKPATEEGQQDMELLINNQNLNKNASYTTTIVPTNSTEIPTTTINLTTDTIEPSTTTSTSTTITTTTSTSTTTATSRLPITNIFITANTNDNLWLSKLKAKLSSSPSSALLQQEQYPAPQQQRYQKYPKTDVTDTYKWNYVLSDLYRQSISQVNFKCPRDGLFSNPINCGQFLQCVYFGTVHERFYILNCPSGLYFNQVIEMCDYPSNVNCPI